MTIDEHKARVAHFVQALDKSLLLDGGVPDHVREVMTTGAQLLGEALTDLKRIAMDDKR